MTLQEAVSSIEKKRIQMSRMRKGVCGQCGGEKEEIQKKRRVGLCKKCERGMSQGKNMFRE